MRLGAALVLVATLAAAAACGGGKDDAAKRGGAGGASTSEPRAVRLVPVSEGFVGRTVVAQGSLAADEEASISFNVPGRIVALNVDLGSNVGQGSVVARLDPSDYQLKVQQAEAALVQARVRLGLDPKGGSDRVNPADTGTAKQAKAVLDQAAASLERTRKLVASGVVARADLDTAQSNYSVADAKYQDALEEVRTRQGVLAQRKSELDIARQQLAYCEVRAPFAGAISERTAGLGEVVTPGMAIAKIVRINPLRLRAEIPEGSSEGVAVGRPARVRSEGQPEDFAGRVARLSPVVNEKSRVLVVEVEVENTRGALRPGGFARAEIATAVSESVVTVPASAVVTFAGIQKVFLVQDGKAVERNVTLGDNAEGDRVDVARGLKAGEMVVAEPGNLAGGQPVVVQ